jgi:hypothetical protein
MPKMPASNANRKRQQPRQIYRAERSFGANPSLSQEVKIDGSERRGS